MKPIRVLLIDDHTLFRSGVKALLSRTPEFEVVGEASDGLDGVKRAKALQPDVVLLDLHMPGTPGKAALYRDDEDDEQTQCGPAHPHSGRAAPR